MKRFLIPKFNFGGHFLEYLSHIYDYARFDKDNEYFFVLSPDYEGRFTSCRHINIEIVSNCELRLYNQANSIFLRDYFENRLLSKLVKRVKPTDVIHITLIDIQRFLPFFTVKGVRYTGIIYYIYLYKWHELPCLRKLQEVLMHKMLCKNKNITNIYVCNDMLASKILNRVLNTEKFKYIPDPFVPISLNDSTSVLDVKECKDKTLYVHFGALCERKGTLEILRAISLLSYDVRKKVAFVFAGRVDETIKKIFYELVERHKHETTIIVKDEFCSFEILGQLCQHADYLLIPYKNAYQSSGVFGYASQFDTPVIALGKNLHRRLIRQYHLGYAIPSTSASAIAEFVSHAPTHPVHVSKKYVQDHTPRLFCERMMN